MIVTSPKVPPAEILPFTLDVHLASSKTAVREALARVRCALGPLALGAEELQTVELVLAEALNNIVEHAYAPQSPRDTITIRGKHQADGLHFRIKDRGKGMPNGEPPLGLLRPFAAEMDEMPEGGFGWFLIRDLAKDVRYRRIGTENQLDLRLAVALTRPN